LLLLPLLLHRPLPLLLSLSQSQSPLLSLPPSPRLPNPPPLSRTGSTSIFDPRGVVRRGSGGFRGTAWKGVDAGASVGNKGGRGYGGCGRSHRRMGNGHVPCGGDGDVSTRGVDR